MNTAIILAAGESTRLNSDIPKQFIKINNNRILDYSIKTFVIGYLEGFLFSFFGALTTGID